MRTRSFWLGIVLAITLVFGSGAAAFGGEVPGLTDDEVVVGWTTPLSGPAALWGVTALGGKAWADYINDQGGINGRKITVNIKDDGYNPTRAISNLQEMKGKVFAVCGLLGTAILNVSKDFFPENNIPLITAYGDVRIWARQPKEKLKNVFISYTDYEDEAEYITKYAVKNLSTKTISVFYQNDDYGKMALEGVKKALKACSDEAELVGSVPYEVTERALETHALGLKELGADTLIMYTTPTHGALISKAIAKVGYQPKVLTTFTLGDPIMYQIAGETWEGTYIALPGNSGQPGSDPEADRVAEILRKYNPKIEGKEYLALFGATSMMHFIKGLENAGENPTQQSLVEGMEEIRDWKPEGLGAPITYTPDRHHGVNASRMGIAKEGKVLALEPFTIFEPRF